MLSNVHLIRPALVEVRRIRVIAVSENSDIGEVIRYEIQRPEAIFVARCRCNLRTAFESRLLRGFLKPKGLGIFIPFFWFVSFESLCDFPAFVWSTVLPSIARMPHEAVYEAQISNDFVSLVWYPELGDTIA